ncbi:MAG: PAS domain S-box protein, partial [Pseudomonadota bacterium]
LLSASSLAAGGASWKTVMAFNAPLMVALAVSYAFFAESHGLITAGMVGCYALALGFAASNLQRTVLRSIRIMTRDDSNLQLLERRLDEANEAEAQFRALIEANLDLTMIFSPDGRITYVSPSVADHLGAGPGEFIGRTTKDIIDASDLPRLQAAGARSLSQMGDSVSVPRVSFIAADGASRVLEGRISNMLYIRGVEGFVFQGRAIDKEQSIRQGDGLATRVARS